MNFKKKYKTFFTIFLLCFLSTPFYVCSQVNSNNSFPKRPSFQGTTKFISKPFQNRVFIEEQGQLKKALKENRLEVPGKVLFAVKNNEFNAYFTSTGISFVFSETAPIREEEKEEKEHDEKPKTEFEIVNMQWLNLNQTLTACW